MSTAPAAFPDLDRAISELSSRKRNWHRIWIKDLLELLQRLRSDYAAVCERWVRAGTQAKGLSSNSQGEAEEWLGGPFCVLRNLRLLEASLREAERFGRPSPAGVPQVNERTGQVVAGVLPVDWYDRILYRGFDAEIRLRGDVGLADLADYQALPHQTYTQGKLCLVLGAGNVSSIGPMDVLYKIFNEKKSVLLKMNPVNAYLSPLIEEGFSALIEAGLLRVVRGGAKEGSYLCRHPEVDEIHITGSARTHDAIVYGSGEEGRRRKRDDEPILHKPITSELGNVSPVIVAPGPWGKADIEFQAANIVSMLVNNAGFNCNAARVIVQHEQWSRRMDLLAAIGKLLARIPARKAYYPGAEERWKEQVEGQDQMKVFGEPGEGELPWTLIPDLPHEDEDLPAFREEAFCSLFAETALPADSLRDYLEKAVDFCNERLWGTLNACILVHPRTFLDAEAAEAVERAVDRLRYGTVAVNHWPGVGYGIVSTSWGAYPGHTWQDIQSGIGVVHNSYMFSHVEKSVLRGPFRVWPTPPWFATRRRTSSLARRLTRFEASPSASKLPGILLRAATG